MGILGTSGWSWRGEQIYTKKFLSEFSIQLFIVGDSQDDGDTSVSFSSTTATGWSRLEQISVWRGRWSDHLAALTWWNTHHWGHSESLGWKDFWRWWRCPEATLHHDQDSGAYVLFEQVSGEALGCQGLHGRLSYQTHKLVSQDTELKDLKSKFWLVEMKREMKRNYYGQKTKVSFISWII